MIQWMRGSISTATGRPWLLCVLVAALLSTLAGADEPVFDPQLAESLGADERGMRLFVVCLLRTGPRDGEIKGEERARIFEGHFANINRLAGQRKLVLAGPFEKNAKKYRGLYVFNVSTVEEAKKLVALDPAVEAGVFEPDLTVWYGSAAILVVNDTHKRIEPSKR